jgi:hypothetical protein
VFPLGEDGKHVFFDYFRTEFFGLHFSGFKHFFARNPELAAEVFDMRPEQAAFMHPAKHENGGFFTRGVNGSLNSAGTGAENDYVVDGIHGCS